MHCFDIANYSNCRWGRGQRQGQGQGQGQGPSVEVSSCN